MIVTIITKTYDGKPKYETILREVRPYVDIFKDDTATAQKADAGHGPRIVAVAHYSTPRV